MIDLKEVMQSESLERLIKEPENVIKEWMRFKLESLEQDGEEEEIK